MSDIGILTDLWIYVTAIVLFMGVVLAAVETYALGFHRLWVLLLVVAGAGWVMTEIEPFSFANSDSATYGSAMAVGGVLTLAGYLFATLSAVAIGRLKRNSAQ
ncbi:MAG: hypothetical protein ABIN69_10225 [Aestuariivirga sp.]